MKKRYLSLTALFAGFLFLGLGVGQGLAADREQPQETKKQISTKKENGAPNKNGLSTATEGNGGTGTQVHRDGTAFTKESRISQADRQAAAKRAKNKGFEAKMVEISTDPAVTIETDKGAK